MPTDAAQSSPLTAQLARAQMIESQIRTNDVTDAAVLAAFRAVSMEAFLPERLRPLAYSDQELEIAAGRFLLRPRTLAKLVQLVQPGPRDKALEIGTGCGYGAAILAHVCSSVITLETDPDLSRAALAVLAEQGVTNTRAVATPIAAGWPDDGPYDVIVVHGGAEIVPDAWLAQLAEGGRLAVIVRQGPAASARLYVKANGQAAHRVAFDAAAPVLPGLTGRRGFAF